MPAYTQIIENSLVFIKSQVYLHLKASPPPQLETIVQVHCPSVYNVFILGGRKLVSHLFLLLFVLALANLPNVMIGTAEAVRKNYYFVT